MEPAIRVAIAALVVTLINSVVTAMTFRKNRRLEFLQRRDRLWQQISELTDRNTECQMISARYALVAVRNAGLQLQGEQAEQNKALIASIEAARTGIEEGIGRWNESIKTLHSIYSALTSESDAPEIERMIAAVQVASDSLKATNMAYSSSLHILETSSDFIKATLAERDQQIREINLDFDRAMARLTEESKQTKASQPVAATAPKPEPEE
jgi:hypothetical protein